MEARYRGRTITPSQGKIYEYWQKELEKIPTGVKKSGLDQSDYNNLPLFYYGVKLVHLKDHVSVNQNKLSKRLGGGLVRNVTNYHLRWSDLRVYIAHYCASVLYHLGKANEISIIAVEDLSGMRPNWSNSKYLNKIISAMVKNFDLIEKKIKTWSSREKISLTLIKVPPYGTSKQHFGYDHTLERKPGEWDYTYCEKNGHAPMWVNPHKGVAKNIGKRALK